MRKREGTSANNFNADPDPLFTVVRIRIRILLIVKVAEYTITRLKALQGSLSRLETSMVSVHGPLGLYFEPLMFLNIDPVSK
jgi:hypothetical protein